MNENRDYKTDTLARYHKFNKYGPTDIVEYEIASAIKNQINLFVIKAKTPYIYADGVYRQDETGIILKSYIKQLIYPEIIAVKRINRVYDLLLSDSDLAMTIEDTNCHPNHVINVQNGMLDLKTLKLSEHGADYYRSINQIPHEYIADFDTSGTVTEEFLNGLLPEADDLKMFLEYAGYCLTKDMSRQKFMIIKGQGGTGKSELIHLVEGTIGKENTCSLTIQNINDRFSPAFLIGKLLNVNADISSEAMTDVAGIKKLVGDDTLRAEIKNGAVFNFKPYAKLLFSANRIPEAKDDKTNAFFRRLLILPVNQRCHEIINLSERLREETEQGVFFHMAVRAVHDMYKNNRPLTESESSKEAIQQFYNATDSVMAFLNERTISAPDAKEERGWLYDEYKRYCADEDRQAKTRNGFFENLRDKGFIERKSNGRRYFSGLMIKD